MKSSSRSVCRFQNTEPRVVLGFAGSCPGTRAILLGIGCQYDGGVLHATVRIVKYGAEHFGGRLSAPGRRKVPIAYGRFSGPERRCVYIITTLGGEVRHNRSLLGATVLLHAGRRSRNLVGILVRCRIPFAVGRRLPGLFQR